MFTGIVQEVGTVTSFDGTHLEVEAFFEDVTLGESIAVDGVCLTVASCNTKTILFDLAEETVRRTTLGELLPGSMVNLERSLRAVDRLGGHIMQGHVDGVATIVDIVELKGSRQITFQVPPHIERYLIEKGSVGVDGISLTVAGLENETFWVAVIPETSKRTTLGSKRAGDSVNIEIDQVAKYIEKLISAKGV